MLIEDDAITTMLMEMVIKREAGPRNVVAFANGLSALKELKRRRDLAVPLPQLIFLDINMPVMDGWDFLQELNRDPAFQQLTVIMLTSSVDPADLARAKSNNLVKGYVAKPINESNLQKIFQSLEQA